MSGGDSTGGYYAPEQIPDCAKIFEKTVLNSPKPEVLATIKAGDVLTLALYETEGKKSLVAVTMQGQIAGSITSASLVKIKNCIDQGNNYIAIVEDVTGGRCAVLLRLESIL
jgi:hypothetical protein